MSKYDDLADVLRRVQDREGRLARNGVAMALGMEMVKAAREVVRQKSDASLEVFERLEDEWRSQQPTARERFARRFREALGLQADVADAAAGYAGNTPYNTSWNPPRGWVYGFWSHERHGVVKLGATTQHPQDRMAHFKRKYELDHVAIAFFFEVPQPARVERHWTSYLRSYHCSLGLRESREWFELSPIAACAYVEAAIKSCGLAPLSRPYRLKTLDTWGELDFWPTGQKQLGGRTVSKGE